MLKSVPGLLTPLRGGLVVYRLSVEGNDQAVLKMMLLCIFLTFSEVLVRKFCGIAIRNSRALAKIVNKSSRLW